jgi:periplasmic divalent cation tolerance protein
MAEDGSTLQKPSKVALVLSTVPDAETGERLARQLVKERLIACANLIPGLTSIFRWEEEINRETEVLMLMKTDASLVEHVFGRVAELHPYDVPELLSLPVDSGALPYCRWVMDETIEVSA